MRRPPAPSTASSTTVPGCIVQEGVRHCSGFMNVVVSLRVLIMIWIKLQLNYPLQISKGWLCVFFEDLHWMARKEIHLSSDPLKPQQHKSARVVGRYTISSLTRSVVRYSCRVSLTCRLSDMMAYRGWGACFLLGEGGIRSFKVLNRITWMENRNIWKVWLVMKTRIW